MTTAPLSHRKEWAMTARFGMPICLIVMTLAIISCERLRPEEAMIQAARQLKIETLPSLDAIPVDYGNLVGVTSNSSKPDWAELWFEKPDKTIVVVWVNFVYGALRNEYVVIPRK
jgi:hypothetical protein